MLTNWYNIWLLSTFHVVGFCLVGILSCGILSRIRNDPMVSIRPVKWIQVEIEKRFYILKTLFQK